MTELKEWESFYILLGSAAGALIGLQFVVMTLIAEIPRAGSEQAGAAFATPTVVHFSVAVVLSAILLAPWHGITPPAELWGILGIYGLAYIATVIHRMRTQTAYRPVFEDWLFHAVLPVVAYLIFAISAFTAPSAARESLFAVALGVVALVLIGIHNTWDAVSYHVYNTVRKAQQPKKAENEHS